MKTPPKRYRMFQLKNGSKIEVYWHYSGEKWAAWLERKGEEPLVSLGGTKRLAVRGIIEKLRGGRDAHPVSVQ